MSSTARPNPWAGATIAKALPQQRRDEPASAPVSGAASRAKEGNVVYRPLTYVVSRGGDWFKSILP